MRMTQYFFPTLREDPVEAEVLSHKLMLRGGFIRKLAAGIYSLLPLGNRVIRKVENIVREEMNRAGAQEVLMPAVVPSELWKESGRWEKYGPELLRIKDRNGRDFCFGPTHEEVITSMVRGEVRSYKQLPLTLYQIQTKFRDEVRPRFGLMRGREFTMKDAYSFHASVEDLDVTYKKMHEAYCRIFERCGLKYKVIEADTGNIGGAESHEFMVLADTGEDEIIYCESCNYAANRELAFAYNTPLAESRPVESKMRMVATPNVKTVMELKNFFRLQDITDIAKSIIYMADEEVVLAMVRGDHQVNEIKLAKVLGCQHLTLANDQTILEVTGAQTGYSGPVGLKKKIKIIADNAVLEMPKAIIGANQDLMHYKEAVIGIDIKPDLTADIRAAEEGDLCGRCHKAHFKKARGIEVGHIFKLGTKYSQAMSAFYTDKDSKEQPFIMGCYGIGIGRTAAAAIEQNNDAAGIIWPLPLAPFQVNIIIVNSLDQDQKALADKIYDKLLIEGIEVIYDDRDERAGVKFKDSELIGFPITIVVGKAAKENKVEVQSRKTKVKEIKEADNIVSIIKGLI